MALTKITNSAIADDIGLGGNPTTSTQTAGNSTTRIATTAFVSTAVANLVDSAPDTLNTLAELATSIGNSTTLSSTLTSSIATKLPLAGGTLTGNLNLGDNVRARFGLDSDLQIYHTTTGNHSVISETGSGNLIIAGDNVEINNAANNANKITATSGGAVTLFHNNAPKIATTGTGIDVTGNIGVTGTVDGIDIAARDAVLTSTTTTAGAALPKAGGTMTGDLSINYAGNAKATIQAVGDYFPFLDMKRTGGSSKTNYAWTQQIGSTGFFYIKDITNGYYPFILNTSGDVLLSSDTSAANPILNLDRSAGSATFSGNIAVSGTVDGVDIAARDAVLTSTTTTAGAALPKAGGTMTGALNVNVTGSDVDAVTITGDNVTDFDFVANPPEFNLEDNSSTSGSKRARITVNSNQFQISALPDDDSSVSQYLFYGNLNNGNVGIGTDAPGARLHVYTTGYPSGKFERYGTSTATRGWTQIGHSALGYSGGTGADSYIISQNGFGFAVNEGTNALTITDGGKVGIGTSDPKAGFQVMGPATATVPAAGSGVVGGAIFSADLNTYGMHIGSITSGVGYIQQQRTNTATHYGLALQPNGGGVGIGTTAPAYKFDVYGTDDITMRVHRPSSGLALTDTCGIGFSHRGDTNTSTSDTRAAIVSTYNGSLHLCTEPGGDLNSNPVDHAALSIVGTTQNVGIGLTSPINTKLVIQEVPATIVGGNAISGSTMKGIKLQTTLNGDESVGLWFGTNSGTHWSGISGQRKNSGSTWGTNLSFYTHENAATALTYARERMIIDSEGNVGIGTSTPAKKLHISSGVNDTPTTFRIENTDATIETNQEVNTIEFYTNDSSGSGTGISGKIAQYAFNPGNQYGMLFSTYNVTESGLQERMRIDATGNVGIGTSTPASNVDMQNGTKNAHMNVNFGPGASAVDKEGYLNLYRRDSSSNQTKIGVFRSGIPIGGVRGAELWSYQALALVTNTGAGHIVFKPQGTEKVRIDTTGNLLVGCIAFSNPTSGLTIAAGGETKIQINHVNGTGSGVAYASFRYNQSVLGSITQHGTSATLYNTSSDYRLKEDDVPMTGATERVKALRPVNFAWKADGSRTDGFLAHEAQAVVPECVTGTKDAMRDEEYEVTAAVLDDEGSETTAAVMGTRSVPDMQGIDQSKLVPLLTAAIQEQQTLIEALIARITALEA